MPDDSYLSTPRSRFRTALVLAIIADALQILIFPLFAEGALSPLEDILDFVVALALIRMIGWHWEFLPSFVGELLPGVDLVPFWTLAVANVYRKWKKVEPAPDTQPAYLELINVTPERHADGSSTGAGS